MKPLPFPEEMLLCLESLCLQHGNKFIFTLIAHALAFYEMCRHPKELNAYDRLTPRLRKVLALVADGLTRKEIAAELHVSVKTVEFHQARLRETLTALLTLFAMRVKAVRP